ncbi:MAG TPA: DUF3307 domain-containing protein [Rhizobiales bacterium]|nr:hypothetical protein BMS3Bbin10_01971 [bacterium BMS3Bbin10]HDO52338.1 DUF3307 domain-containing protein [Hyphomicrobiales bacterium]
MSVLTGAILLAFVVLAVKHTIADYFLQTSYQYGNKGIYGHPGGLIHAGFHALLTLPVFLVLPPSSLALAAAIITGEFVLHYHLDWSKEQLVKRYRLTQKDALFWNLFGLDQLFHLLTYVAIIAILVS